MTDYAARRDAVFEWLTAREFAGHDPYDGLESRLFQGSPLARSSLMRLAWCQLLKRCPIDLRGLTLVPELRNPKTLGLVLSGLARLPGDDRMAVWAPTIVAWLTEAAHPETRAWGYPFAWQNRAFYAPRETSNAVCSAFVVHGLLDAGELGADAGALDLALGAIPFFVEHLNRTVTPEGVCFSYTPGDTSIIHNVNLLVASVLARAGHLVGDDSLIDLAGRATSHAVAHQRADGSWPYGEGQHQQWIDSFHTGFNLGALRLLERLLPDGPWPAARERGYGFLLGSLLDSEGLPKYFDRTRYPIDAHCCAQAIITLMESTDIDPHAERRARGVAEWTEATLGHGDGTYSYQRGRVVHRRMVYARWCQAWMFRAFCELTRGSDRDVAGSALHDA